MKKLIMLTVLSIACISSLQALKMRSAEDICKDRGLTGKAYDDCVAKEQKRIEEQKAAIKEEDMYYIQPFREELEVEEIGVVPPHMMETKEVKYGPKTGVVSPHMLQEAEAVKKGATIGIVPPHLKK